MGKGRSSTIVRLIHGSAQARRSDSTLFVSADVTSFLPLLLLSSRSSLSLVGCCSLLLPVLIWSTRRGSPNREG